MNRLTYSFPFEPTHRPTFLRNLFAYSWMFGALAGISGELCGWALSRQVSPRRLLIQLGWGAYKGFGFYLFPSHYFWNEGDTNDGRYNPTNPTTLGPNFAGYGSTATSPYRLPIAGGRPIFVGQSHQGMFSHFINAAGGNVQVYASDFAHGFQEMITAIRDGVVVDYFDWLPDDQLSTGAQQQTAINTAQPTLVTNGTNSQTGYAGAAGPAGTTAGNFGGWNFILVQHNNPNGTETAAQLAHDLDQGGVPVTTYAIYGHGANGGVRAAFAGIAPAVAPANIIGTQINRGAPIMQAGDTGVSFHNHLHLHIRPGPVPGSTGIVPEIINQAGLTGNRSLPIVFGDATHPLKSHGPLRNLTWYRSGNV